MNDSQPTTSHVTYLASDEEATARLGRALAEVLPPATVIALDGPLGAGKTRLVQAIAAAAGADRNEVTSPTFVLINEYAGRCPMAHIDAYRLRDDDEFLALGPEEYFDAPGFTFIEWADRVVDCLPPNRLGIRIRVVGTTAREFEIAGEGPQWRPILDRLITLLK